jgi:hypothetical protein
MRDGDVVARRTPVRTILRLAELASIACALGIIVSNMPRSAASALDPVAAQSPSRASSSGGTARGASDTSAAQAPAADPGVPGSTAPQSVDVRMADTLVNQDTHGGTNQSLMCLAASPDAGFAAVWRDQRDGMLGLYLARTNADGELLEPERPIHQPHSGRRLDPALALGKDNSGAVVWVSAALLWVRTFDASGKWLSVDRMLTPMGGGGHTPQGREAGIRQPTIAALPHGGYAVAWTQAGQVHYQELDHDGSPHGNAIRLAPSSEAAETAVQIAVSERGGVLCAWRTKEGNLVINHGRSDTAPVNCGMGVLCRLISDPVGGFWGAFLIEGQPALRHLASDGRPDRADVRPVTAPATGLDLALGDDYLALLVETGTAPRGESRSGGGQRRGISGPSRSDAGDATRDARQSERDARGAPTSASEPRRAGGDGSASSFVLYLLDREGRAHDAPPPVQVASADAVAARGPRIVSNGKRVFACWTDQRNGDQDIYGRTYEPSAAHGVVTATTDPRLGAERRVNTDAASSDQTSPRVASSGRAAVIAWQDERDQVHRVFARVVGASAFDGDEFPLPAPIGGAAVPPLAHPLIQPSVAMRADGDFVVQWKEVGARGGALRAQCFHADKKPIAAPLAIDEGQDVPSHAIVALPGDGGYLTAWLRANKSLWLRRVSSDGTLTAPAQLSETKDGELGDLALALLDDQRAIVVWDVHTGGDAWSLHARFVDADGAPKSDELSFEPSPRKIDWQPCVAPAANNGFVMAWCSGSPNDASHDVVGRVFDSRGKPAGPLLPISPLANEQDYAQIVRLPDKTYVVAWEDDISGYDHTYVRRILPNAHELGRIVRMNELETKAVEDRTAPQIAVLGDGFVGAWNDRRRSLGWDIYARILGPKFDEVKAR